MASHRSVVITGLGVVSPIGNSAPEFWERLVAGQSGLAPITRFDASCFRNALAGEVKGLAIPEGWERADAYAAAACREAMESAGCVPGKPLDAGLLLGTNFGCSAAAERALREHLQAGSLHAADLEHYLFQKTADRVAQALGLSGSRSVLSLSCASGAAAIGHAAALIGSGRAERFVACGFDELSLYAYAGLSALRAISSDTVRPFSKTRSGTIFAEGAGAVFLESEEAARARGVRPLARVLGSASNNDAYHMTAPEKTGAGIQAAMRLALANAGLAPERIGHLNAHGTGTQYNDLIETESIKAVFGAHAPRIPITANKSVFGHTMGAAGAHELIATVLALRDGVIPPILNFQERDPALDLDYVFGEKRACAFDVAMTNSYGFGGCNACVILEKAA